MEKLYCTIFLVDVSQNPEEVETVSSRIVQLIEDHGGVIKLNNPWGKRRLAYPIEGRTSAFYFEIEFTASSHLNIPSIIEKEYRLNDRVLRYLTYVVTKEELEQRRLNERRGRTSAGDDNRSSQRGRDGESSKPATEKADKAEAKAPAKEEKAEKPAEAAETKEESAETEKAEAPAETQEESATSEKAEEAVEAEPETTTTEKN